MVYILCGDVVQGVINTLIGIILTKWANFETAMSIYFSLLLNYFGLSILQGSPFFMTIINLSQLHGYFYTYISISTVFWHKKLLIFYYFVIYWHVFDIFLIPLSYCFALVYIRIIYFNRNNSAIDIMKIRKGLTSLSLGSREIACM